MDGSAPLMPRALWFPRPRSTELRDEPLPELGTDDVRIRAVASGVSAGTEMLVYRGQVPDDLQLDLPTLRGSFRFPIKYGYAGVGRVVETGATVEHLKPGDLIVWGGEHIGLVESVDANGTIHTIEGNSSDAVSRCRLFTESM